jgi:hypothetical protein
MEDSTHRVEVAVTHVRRAQFVSDKLKTGLLTTTSGVFSSKYVVLGSITAKEL